MKKMEIDKTWTCFLDRDGVINQRKIGGYIESVEEFVFLPDSLLAIAQLSKVFGRVIIVTNQQGIGKGLMDLEDLEKIHASMLQSITHAGGHIDKIYYCPHLATENCACRKPNTGMALQAKEDYPDINFERSAMIGDSDTDMLFGEALGMTCIGVGDEIRNISSIRKIKNLAQVLNLISDMYN